jgi:hypothetical protein
MRRNAANLQKLPSAIAQRPRAGRCITTPTSTEYLTSHLSCLDVSRDLPFINVMSCAVAVMHGRCS